MAPSSNKPVRSRRRRASRIQWAMLLGMAVAPACGGSGGCSSCSGVTPLPGGFINEERVENAAAVRITQSGFDFLEDNIGTLAGSLLGDGADQGVITFPINEISDTVEIPVFPDIDYTVCPGGPNPNADPPTCTAEIDIGNADLGIQPIGPHNIEVAGVVPLRLRNLPLDTSVGDFGVSMTGNQSCPGENQLYAPINVTIVISIETDQDPTHARQGYSRVRINSVSISESDIEDAIKLNCDGGFVADLANAAKGLIVGQLLGGLSDTLVSSIEDQLCQAANPDVNPPCPTGTNDVNGTCRYGTTEESECVSIVLGTDGHANLSGLLQGISPGTKGGMDFLLAAGGQSVRDDGSGQTWGDLNPIGNGATLGMMGGVEPNPISGCVPISDVPRPSGLKIPNELIDDSLVTNWPAGTPGPHLGLGISESFFNYALSGMYNSGLLCIGLSTETVDLLNSGTLGLLAQSLRDLGIQQESQPIAIVLKPKNPPHVTFGNGTNLTDDPNILLELPEAGFDFYVFSSDRYVRFMTATFDIKAPVNLTVTPEGLVPVLDELGIENGVVSNTELLKEDPAVIAAALQGLLASQIGGLLGGGLPTLDLNGSLESLGLRMVIPETVEGQGSAGLRKLDKDGERYLGIFAALELAPEMQTSMVTSAEVVDLEIDQAGLRGETMTPSNAPKLTVLAEVMDDHGQIVEHQVRVDGGLWKPWTRNRYIHVTGNELRIEGRHEVEVRSRIAGQPYSTDVEPVLLEVLIDTVAPDTKVVESEDGLITLSPVDLVSDDELLVRYRFDDGAWSNWVKKGDLAAIEAPELAEQIEIESKDEAGNLGTAQHALIRGLPQAGGDGCGCEVPGQSSSRLPGSLLIAGVGAAIALLRRRAKKSASGSSPSAAEPVVRKPVSSTKRPLASRALIASIGLFGLGSSFGGCSCDDETETDDPQNTPCNAPDCKTLEPSIIGNYTSAALDKKGNLWVAGYNEAFFESAFSTWGDLAVGKYEDGKVAWQTVDGVPTEPTPDPKKYNVKGFRGGQTAAGDDVGIWTSLAIDPATDQPTVAYFDRTNTALKFATFNGTAWEIEVVDDAANADSGRYAKLVYTGNTATIAYQTIESVSSGKLVSKVKLATRTGNGFTLEDVYVNAETPCRFGFCSGGTVCVVDEGTCSASSSACAACAADESCVDVGGSPQCRAVYSAPRIEPYPVATGLYVSSVANPGGGVAIAFYDRVAGTVNLARKDGAEWSITTVDGGANADGTFSDVGIGNSLFVDGAGAFHLAYVDGYAETLKFASDASGSLVIETIDDGLSVNGVPHPDGQHVIGDDANVLVDGGSVTVTYQDASSGDLRYASRNGQGDWDVKVLETGYFGGFFSKQLPDGRIVSWGRKVAQDEATGGLRGFGDVTVTTP